MPAAAPIGALGQAHDVKRDQRPRPQADLVGADLAGERRQHAGEREHDRRQRLREPAAAERAHQPAGHEHAGRAEQRRYRAQQHQRMAEQLRRGRHQRDERRLVDVAPVRVEAADDEVQLVAEVAVVRVGDEVQQEDRRGGDPRDENLSVVGVRHQRIRNAARCCGATRRGRTGSVRDERVYVPDAGSFE